jgi:hypothetical protein
MGNASIGSMRTPAATVISALPPFPGHAGGSAATSGVSDAAGA